MGLFSRTGSGVKPGDEAPDFELPDQDGQLVSLRSYRGTRNVVLYFYPRDETAGCTVQACTFRDQLEQFTGLDAEVLGVSSDSAASHRGFADRHRLPFRLLADEGGRVRARYGVPKTLGLFDGRVTYVIDRHGVVRHVFESPAQVRKHVAEALSALRSL